MNLKDIISIRIPYPTAQSGLAKVPHMYICVANEINFDCFDI
jgi:hypothetical protein